MGTIKPAEVSAILLDELTNFDKKGSLNVKGTVLQVGDGVARVYGMRDAESGELVEFDRFAQVQRTLAAFVERPAVQRGLAVPGPH